MGAWIEMEMRLLIVNMTQSLPSWERGLKCYQKLNDSKADVVAPLVGAWIEILIR